MLPVIQIVVFLVSASIGYLATEHTKSEEAKGEGQVQVAQQVEDSASQMDRLSQNETVWEIPADGVASSDETPQ